MPTELEQAIARTLCWFSIFEYPLTSFEIRKWMLQPERSYSLFEIQSVLEKSVWMKKHMWIHQGFFGLKQVDGKEVDPTQWVQKRTVGYVDTQKKMRLLKRVAAYFRLFSSVKFVAAVNSLAWAQTNERSDIDLFVVTKPHQLWFTRFWLVLPFVLFKARPNIRSSMPAFCFSYFVTEDALSFESSRLHENDYYFAYWFASMVPLFDRQHIGERMEKANIWVHRLLPQTMLRKAHKQHKPLKLAPIFFSVPMLEPLYRWLQEKRFPVSIRLLANKDTRVIVSDTVLKFHDQDRRAEFFRLYQDRLHHLL